MLTSPKILRLDLRNIELRRRLAHGLPRLGAALYVCSLQLTFLETKEPLPNREGPSSRPAMLRTSRTVVLLPLTPGMVRKPGAPDTRLVHPTRAMTSRLHLKRIHSICCRVWRARTASPPGSFNRSPSSSYDLALLLPHLASSTTP
jgi:hypothetical protein